MAGGFGGGNPYGAFDPAAQARLRGGIGGIGQGQGGAATGAGQPAGAGATPGAQATSTPNPHQGAVNLTPGQSPISYNGTDVAGQWGGTPRSNPFQPMTPPTGGNSIGLPTPTPNPNHPDQGAGGAGGAADAGRTMPDGSAGLLLGPPAGGGGPTPPATGGFARPAWMGPLGGTVPPPQQTGGGGGGGGRSLTDATAPGGAGVNTGVRTGGNTGIVNPTPDPNANNFSQPQPMPKVAGNRSLMGATRPGGAPALERGFGIEGQQGPIINPAGFRNPTNVSRPGQMVISPSGYNPNPFGNPLIGMNGQVAPGTEAGRIPGVIPTAIGTTSTGPRQVASNPLGNIAAMLGLGPTTEPAPAPAPPPDQNPNSPTYKKPGR